MKKIFIDTSALVALFDRSDNNHQKAKTLLEIIRNNKIKLLMSDYIFDETITTVLSNAGHKTAIRIGEFILGSNIVELSWLDESIIMKAWEYFKRHSDKEYSFTDCTTFILMEEMKLSNFFAFDEDFVQAGFIDFSSQYSI